MQGRTHLDSATAHVAVGTLGGAWVLGIASMVGPWLVAAGLGALVAVLAWGWAGTLGLPTPRGTRGVLLVGGAAIVLSVGLRGEPPWLIWLPAALAIAMIAAFLHQLLRRDGRPRVVESVSSVVLGLSLVASAAVAVPLSRTEPGAALVVAAMAAVGVSAVGDLAGRWRAARPWTVPGSLVLGGLAGLACAAPTGQPWTVLVLTGVACGGVSHAMRAVFSVQPSLAHARPRLVAALASVLVVGVIPYVVGATLLPGALAG